MVRLLRLAAAAVFVLACSAASAHDYTAGTLQIGHPFARATPPGAQSGGAFFTVHNAGHQADRLLAVASPAAAAAELHRMTMDGNVMKMRAVDAIDIAAGATVTLGTAGYHVMLTGLKHPLVAGQSVPLTLTFERAGRVDVSASVEPLVAGGSAPHGAGHSP